VKRLRLERTRDGRQGVSRVDDIWFDLSFLPLTITFYFHRRPSLLTTLFRLVLHRSLIVCLCIWRVLVTMRGDEIEHPQSSTVRKPVTCSPNCESDRSRIKPCLLRGILSTYGIANSVPLVHTTGLMILIPRPVPHPRTWLPLHSPILLLIPSLPFIQPCRLAPHSPPLEGKTSIDSIPEKNEGKMAYRWSGRPSRKVLRYVD